MDANDSFVPDTEDSFVEERQSENFLQSAIKSAGALIPQSGAELGDVGRIIGRQIPMTRGGLVNAMTMGPFGQGANIAGIKEVKPVVPEPQTEWGRVMERQVVDPASIAIPSALVGKSLLTGGARGLGSMFSRFFSEKPIAKQMQQLPLQERGAISSLESEFGTSPYISGEGKIGKEFQLRQQLGEKSKTVKQQYQTDLTKRRLEFQQGRNVLGSKRNEVETAANELSYTGKKSAEDALKSKIREFHEMYDERIGSIGDEVITRAELADAVRNSGSRLNLGVRKILEGDEAILKSLPSEILPPKRVGESISKYNSRANAKLKANDVKAFLRNLRGRMNPTDHPLSEVYSDVGELISTKMPEYAQLREDYKPMYELIKKTKKMFGEGGIKGLTKTTVSPSKMSEAEALQEELGVQITGKAQSIAQKRSELAKQLKLDVSDLRETRDNQIDSIYKKISSSKESQSRMIHELRNKVAGTKAGFESKKNFLQSEIEKRRWRKGIAATIATLTGVGGVATSFLGKILGK